MANAAPEQEPHRAGVGSSQCRWRLGLGPPQSAAASLPGRELQLSSHCLGVSTLVPSSLPRMEKTLCPALVLTDRLFRCLLPVGECCPQQQ